MRTLALDYGKKRIGVAVTDPTGVIAQPLTTIERSRKKDPLQAIDELVGEYEVGQIVLGLPLHMNGRVGPEAEEARAFGREVESRTGVAVDYLDERWTTLEARNVLSEIGGLDRKERGRVDRVAAAVLLRSYLERQP